LRIYPGFLVAMILCVFLFGPLGAGDVHAYWTGVLHSWRPLMSNTLNLSADWQKPPFDNTLNTVPLPHQVDGSMWTIRYEFQCYMMVLVLGLAVRYFSHFIPRRILRAAPLVLFVTVYVLYAGLLHGHFISWADRLNAHRITFWLIGGSTYIPRLFIYFIAGMCLYVYRRHLTFNVPLMVAALVALIASCFVPGLLPLTLPLVGPYLLLAIAFAPWLKLGHIGSKTDLSYGIYLYAFPVQQLLTMYFSRYLTPALAFIAALAPTVLLAWLSWTLIEKQALRLKGGRRKNGIRPQSSHSARAKFPC
jgi:peptidoglycan/LPS O-acetylase OafA/YrhL